MSIDSQFEREEDALTEDYNAGRITLSEYNKQIADLNREYRAMAQESAQDAYDREMDRW